MNNTFCKSIEDIRKETGLMSNVDFDVIQPNLSQALANEIIPLIGRDFYEHLILIANPTGKNKTLIEYIRRAEACIGLGYWTFTANVSIQNFLLERADANFQAAKQWRVDDLREYLYSNGFNALDEALSFLVENEEDFPNWKSSEENKKRKNLIVTSAQEFQQWHNINKSFRTYLALVPIMSFIQEFHLKSRFSPIWEKIRQADYGEIKFILDAALIKLTVAKACDQNLIDFVSGRLILKSRRMNNNQQSTPTPTNLDVLKSNCNEEAGFLLDTAIKTLNDKASDTKFKEWFESSFYSNPQSKNDVDGCDKIYVL